MMDVAPEPTTHETSTVPVRQPTRRDQVRLMRRLLSTPQSALDDVAAAYGPICGLGAGPLRMTIIGQPALIRELLMLPNDRTPPFLPLLRPCSMRVRCGPVADDRGLSLLPDRTGKR